MFGKGLKKVLKGIKLILQVSCIYPEEQLAPQTQKNPLCTVFVQLFVHIHKCLSFLYGALRENRMAASVCACVQTLRNMSLCFQLHTPGFFRVCVGALEHVYVIVTYRIHP